MIAWPQLSPTERDRVAAEWRALRARERPPVPVEDRPPVEVRVAAEPVRHVERAEAQS